MKQKMKITAIVLALNEEEFIAPCIKAIYPFADRINIQTNYDRSFAGLEVQPDKTVQNILSIPDKAGKISLHITRIPDESVARNWLMRSDGYRLDHRQASTTARGRSMKDFCDGSDYFWIVDADEIYDPDSIPRILEYLAARKPRVLRIRGITYFKAWNYCVHPSDGFIHPGFIKPDVLFYQNRNLLMPAWLRLVQNKYLRKNGALNRASSLLYAKIERAMGIEYLSEDIGVFHHASYVGSDLRMAKKISCSVHYEDKMRAWYKNVWKEWTPISKNLHPLYPDIFKSTVHIPTSSLPSSIRNEFWPDGYIEKL